MERTGEQEESNKEWVECCSRQYRRIKMEKTNKTVEKKKYKTT